MTIHWPSCQGTAALLVLALFAVTACSRGPSEAHMLPEKDLVYPGATETYREFRDEDSGRTVDGDPNHHPAELRVDYRVASPLDIESIQRWYRDQLTQRGRTYKDLGPGVKSSSLEMTKQQDGFAHTYLVDGFGSADAYELRYQLRTTQ